MRRNASGSEDWQDKDLRDDHPVSHFVTSVSKAGIAKLEKPRKITFKSNQARAIITWRHGKPLLKYSVRKIREQTGELIY